MALDVGERRIGVAIGDELGMIASPLAMVRRGATDAREIRDLAGERGVTRLVVGLPTGMSGREGPQAAIVREFWRELPREYRYNHQLARQEDEFLDWDCAQEGFEGIRAQDILPLLVERFGFDLFAPFANVIDPFIDRGFGHNFDAGADWDRAFIDRVHARDEAEIRRGAITPTHLFAVMCVGRPGEGLRLDGLEPRACIRRPD